MPGRGDSRKSSDRKTRSARDTYRRDSQGHDDKPARAQGNDGRDSGDSANKSGPR
jgi:hypothetical protein